MGDEGFSEGGKDAVSWNLSSRVIFLIGHHMQSASMNFARNNQHEGFRSYNEIAVLIDPDLHKKERKILDALEKRITTLQGKINRLSNLEEVNKLNDRGRRELLFYRGRHHILVQEYRTFLMNLLDDYGYLISRSKDASKMFSGQ